MGGGRWNIPDSARQTEARARDGTKGAPAGPARRQKPKPSAPESPEHTSTLVASTPAKPRVDNTPLAKKMDELRAAQAAAAFSAAGLQAAEKVKAARATMALAMEEWWAANAARRAARAAVVAKQQPTLEELQEKFKGDREGLLAAVLARKAHRHETRAERHRERAAERERQEALLTDLLDKQSAEVVRALDAEDALLILTLAPLRQQATALAKLVADRQCAGIWLTREGVGC